MPPPRGRHRKHPLLASCLLALVAAPAAPAADGPDEARQRREAGADGVEFTTELDPYYSNAAVYTDLNDEPIPEVEVAAELALYRQLLNAPLVPQQAAVEVSVNPMPVLGVYVREAHGDVYDALGREDGFNLVRALTEGFPEPYALSFFLGSVVRYDRPGAPSNENNRGISGYLLSVGDRHIRKNRLVDDDWLQFEWKVKGDRDFGDRRLSWSARAGFKLHSDDRIEDFYYLAIRRNHFDASIERFSWIDNADIEYRVEFDTDDGDIIQHELFMDQKWPVDLEWRGIAAELGVGFVVESGKYSGELAPAAGREVRLILRPSLSF